MRTFIMGTNRWLQVASGALADAQSPATSGERLREIAEAAGCLTEVAGCLPEIARAAGRALEQSRLLAALAENPNTPPDVLARVAPCNWKAFFRNPIAPLLGLESPEFYAEITPAQRRAILRLTPLPTWVLAWLGSGHGDDAADPYTAQEARLHISAGEQGKTQGKKRLRATLRHLATLLTPTDAQAHAEMVELGLAPAWFTETKVPVLTVGPPIRETIGWRVPEDRASLQNPTTTPAQLISIAQRYKQGDSGMLWAVLKHPGVNQNVLVRLLDCHDAAVRRAARRHPEAPQDMDEFRRLTLKWALAEDDRNPAPLCRLVALLHPETPQGRVDCAADSDYWTDRLAAAHRATNGLKALTHDPNIFVRTIARERIGQGNRPLMLDLGR